MLKKPILVPCLLMLSALSALSAQDTSVSAQASMNWNTNLIHSVISLDARKKGIELPTGRSSALQILEMETPSFLKDTFFSILVNSSEKLGNAVAQNEISLTDLNTVIEKGKKTPPYFSLDQTAISMTHTMSMTDIGSLFITNTASFAPKIPLETVPSRAYTGILIDARGLLKVHGEYVAAPLVPCLFPRVWSGRMDLLYEKNMVSPEKAKAKGIVTYSASLDEGTYRDRIGNDPLRITAREIFGINRTDPVISQNDYLKIMSIPANRQLLNDGSVVIICDPDQLEMKNLGPVKDDNYYFTWEEIDAELNKKGVSRIDFSNTWEGMKLTIYDIRFVADTAKVLAEEQSRLDAIADALSLAGPDAHFNVEGHTASVGKPAGEMALSIERAKKIAEELAKRGIDASHIEASGFGGTRPLASNETDDGRAMNRRVEITIRLD